MTKLPRDLSFPKSDLLVAPFLMVPLLTTDKVTKTPLRWFANKMARSKVNAIRSFAFINREPNTIENNPRPFQSTGTIFDLRIKNHDYIDRIRDRLEFFRERRITNIITFYDQTSWAKKYWPTNCFNGKNNWNGTSILKGSLGHWYENVDKPPPQGPAAEATGAMFENWMRWMIEEFDSKYTVWELINEGTFGSVYHDMYGKLFRDLGVPKRRRITSSIFKWFPKNEKLYQHFGVSIHKVDSLKTYEDSKQYIPKNVPWFPSGDGPKPITNPTRAYNLVSTILNDGQLGYEGNDRPIWHEGDWTFRSLNWGVARAMGKALEDFIHAR